MKKNYPLLLTLAGLLFLTPHVKGQTFPYGVWQAFGDQNKNGSQLKGRLVSFNWSDIEPTKGNFTWTAFDAGIKKKTKNDLPGSYGTYPVIVSIFVYNVGNDENSFTEAPGWLYGNDLDIPKVTMDITPDAGGNVYHMDAPYFYSKDYQDRFKIMTEAVRDHIANNAAATNTDIDLRSSFQKVIGVQACFGSTGDYISYKGTVTYPTTASSNYICTVQKESSNGDGSTVVIPNYACTTAITPADFDALFHIFSKMYQTAYYTTGEPVIAPQKIRVLHNPSNNGSVTDTWLLTYCPGTWRKGGSIGHIYQVTDEATNLAFWKTTLSNPQYTSSTSDKYVRARSEIVGGSTGAGWWTGVYTASACTTYSKITRGSKVLSGYPQKNLFTLYASLLNYGGDIANPEANMIEDLIYDSALQFFNRHAGQKDPFSANTVTGFCMLRDGLDASDVNRFDIGTYGDFTGANATDANKAARAYNILNLGASPLKNYGALLEDPCKMIGNEAENRRAAGINDVVYGINPGNYERYITQIAPDIDGNGSPDPMYNTCNGYWNINAIGETTSVFGRFGKSIYSLNNSTNKAGMYFNVSDDYLSNYTGNLKITVHYLDKDNLNWSFLYKPANATSATLIRVGKGNTNTWKSVTFDVDAVVFKNRGNSSAYNSDFYLYATTTSATTPKETIFSLIEIAKAPAGVPAPVAKNNGGKKIIDNITISPNPASDRFTVEMKDRKIISSIDVYNQYGMLVMQRSINSFSTVILRSQIGNAPGIYFVAAKLASGEIIRKEVKVL